ncbi:MAG: ubiquitin-conjugating enzyme E2 [Bacteroidota bacterium]
MPGKSLQELTAYYAKQKFRNPRDKRLAKEHLSIAQLADQTNRITYQPVGRNLPPEGYLVGYHVRSIVGVDGDEMPIYGNYHEVEITFPSDYPISAAKLYMKSQAWHPNIKAEGRFKGRICGNTSEFGKAFNLNMLTIRIGEILQYKNYHAEQTAPFPEDENVARWIRDVAEPRDIVNKNKGIVVDDSSLLVNRDETDYGDSSDTPPPPPPPKTPPPPPPPISTPQDAPPTRKTIKINRSTRPTDSAGRRTIKINPKSRD